MPSSHRPSLETLDLGALVQFHRVLRAVTMAMQPPRLVTALLMVCLLLAGGRAWDAVSGREVSPGGLTDYSNDERGALQSELRAAVLAYVDDPEDRPAGPPNVWRLDTRETLDLLAVHYGRDRARAERGVSGREEGEGVVNKSQIHLDDRQYLDTLERIHVAQPRGVFEAVAGEGRREFVRLTRGVVTLRPGQSLDAAIGLFVRLPLNAWRLDRAFALVYGVFFLLVVALGGGALCRMAACDFGGRERLRVREAFDFAFGAWGRLIGAPLLPLLLAGVFALVLAGLGLLMTVDWLDIVGALLYPIGMLIGFLIAFLIIIYTAGFSLLVPAVACERCDAADAHQRAYAYVINRPLHLIGYTVVAVIGLAVGYVIVALFASVMLNVTASLYGVLTWSRGLAGAGGFAIWDLSPPSLDGFPLAANESVAAGLIGFWQRLIVLLVVAYVFAYYFAASTIVYLLVRRSSDGQDVGELWRPGDIPGTMIPAPAKQRGRLERGLGAVASAASRRLSRRAAAAPPRPKPERTTEPKPDDADALGPELLSEEEREAAAKIKQEESETK